MRMMLYIIQLKKKYFSFPVDNLTVETEWCVSMEKEK